MNGISVALKLLLTLLTTLVLGSYAHTWSVQESINHKLERIDDRVLAIYDILRNNR